MRRSNWSLYAAYTCTCMEDRAWSFLSSVVLESIGGMRFVSIGQFSESFVQMVLSGNLGAYLDCTSKSNAIVFAVALNNFSMLAAIGFMLISLIVESPRIALISVYSSIAFCSLNRLFLNAEKSIISRDWIVMLGDSTTLSRENATLTSLDQILNIVAPIGVGALVTAFGVLETLIVFGIFSILSFLFKSFFLHRVVESVNYQRKLTSSGSWSSESSEETSEDVKSKGVLKTYFKQKTFTAALGMALFYKTVMGFDNLALGYAKTSSDLSIFTIGAFKSYGSLAGMAGAVSYAIMEHRIGVVKAGFVGLIVQQTCSLVAVASVWMPGSPMDLTGYFGKGPIKAREVGYSIPVFLAAIATARYGLWCLDLAVTHAMQIHVPEAERNTVFGVHMALCQAFSVPKELLVIVFPEPSVFVFYILISYFCVTGGQVLYCCWARKFSNSE